MAEFLAQPFVSFVVERLGDLLVREARFLGGVSGQVREMQTELTRMQCFLKDADARREGDKLIQNWVGEIREVAYDAEDVIETFVIKVAFRRRTGFLNVPLMRFSCVVKDSVALQKVRVEIESIKTKISSIRAGLETYGIRREDESSRSTRYERQQQLRRSYPHIMEDDIVGVDEDLKTIVEHLVKDEIQCRVVSIWGMGGLGKTTLAKMVYNHADVRRHFDCFAWAYISQQCNTREVLEGILIKLTSSSPEKKERIKKMEHDELVGKLYKVQSQKKCLVILDDIWKAESWDSLSPGFPNTKVAVGSKILVTTRNREVALYIDQQCYLHELRHLTEEESWELFQKKVSRRREGTEFRLSTEMTVIGKEMVKHCGGLPLAIVVLGGVLATKHKLGEWDMVRRNIHHYFSKGKGQGEGSITDILALSYHDLPYHLKACFMCFSHLPEDEGIRPEELVQKWMAEGFVPTQVGEVEELTMLEVGMSYLDELVDRCMVQVQLTRFSQRVKFCRLHDLMRDLCLLKAREENFLKVVYMGGDSDSSSSSLSSSTTIRRLSVHYLGNRGSGSDGTRREYDNHHHVRSCQFYFFGNRLEDSDWQDIESLLKSFKKLRALDLQRANLGSYDDKEKMLPREVGNLIHLRYLSLRDSTIRDFPPSVGNLAFLETLDLWVYYRINIIPKFVERLKQLKHLYLPNARTPCIGCIGGKLRLDGLRKLETLQGFRTEYCDVSCFSKLTNLRKLGIAYAAPKDLAGILLSNSNPLLKYSSFYIEGDFQTQEEQSLLRQLLGCRHLHKLDLCGSLNLAKLPDQFPLNLTKLFLEDSKLEEDPMPTLEKLPNLTRLRLWGDFYMGKKIVCSAPTPSTPSNSSGGGHGSAAGGGGFPQLKVLILGGTRNLEEWRVEEGSMPSLLHLKVLQCPKLKDIPDGLKFVTTLQELEIIGVSQELKDRLREGGEDFYKVQHVPSIKFRNY